MLSLELTIGSEETVNKKIISFMHISLDGLVAGPNREMNWIKVDEEIFDHAGIRISRKDAKDLLGVLLLIFAPLRDKDKMN